MFEDTLNTLYNMLFICNHCLKYLKHNGTAEEIGWIYFFIKYNNNIEDAKTIYYCDKCQLGLFWEILNARGLTNKIKKDN